MQELKVIAALFFILGVGLTLCTVSRKIRFSIVVVILALFVFVATGCAPTYVRRDPLSRTVGGAAVGAAVGAAGGAIAGDAGKGAAIGAVVGGLLGLATSEPEYPFYYPEPYSCYYVARPYGPPALVCPEPPPPPVIVYPRLWYYSPPVIVIEPRHWWGDHRGFGRDWNGGNRGDKRR